MKILVIGESCKDVFKYGKAERICPEAPAIVFNPINEDSNGGMAMNVNNNLESLGADVTIHTNLNWHEITKTRFVDKKTNYILLREDNNDTNYGRADVGNIEYSQYDAIVISDYNKGFLTEADIRYVAACHPLVFLDTKKLIGRWCDDIAFIKINNYELKKVQNISKSLNKKLIITLGPEGAMHRGTIYPVPAVEIKDLSGAGDTFMSALVIKYVEVHKIDDAIRFANECATKVVQKSGVSVI